MGETITVVPLVKAYPALLSDLDEAVCVAGLRTELLTPPAWVRLWPVPFRDLDDGQRFRKWQEITVSARRSTRDQRPESLVPDPDTIVVSRTLSKGERRHMIDQMPDTSMCGLIREQAECGTSLGIVRPREVIDVVVEERDPEEVSTQQRRVEAAAAQQKLFGTSLTPLEVIPHRFLYRYRCWDPDCNTHHQGIIDWEISAAYRKWRKQYPTDFIERIRCKWLGELCGPERDTRFYVGNMHQHPRSFLVLGVYWPKR